MVRSNIFIIKYLLHWCVARNVELICSWYITDIIVTMTLSMSVDIADRDVIKMIEEYLANRHLDISLMCLERETGIINGVFSDDGLFLRQLILDGHWDDTLEFLQPLEGIEGYDKKRCQYLVYKHKYLELLCIKHDPGPLQNHEFTLDEVISCLTELEVLCTDRKEYDNLCFLLTLPSITADKSYENWNPSSARVNCFNELYPLVKKFVGLEKRRPPHSSSKHDRLLSLVTKGLLYEMCVQLCTTRACGSTDNVTANHTLGGSPCSDADLSLISWLQKVPAGTFACPFEKKSLKLKIDKLDKPSLEAVWSEQLLSTPIRPKQFPHTSIPARTRSSQLVSQSMMAMYDGLSSNLYMPHSMRGSMSDPRSRRTSGSPQLSRSYAHSPSTKFLLTNSLRSDRKSNPMTQSVERLFMASGHSSPRPLSSSPLLRDEAKKCTTRPEVLSPPPSYDISPTCNSNPTPTGASSNQRLPLSSNSTHTELRPHPPSPSVNNQTSQPDQSNTHYDTHSYDRPHEPHEPSQSPPSHISQGIPQEKPQKPDLLQHDVKEEPLTPVLQSAGTTPISTSIEGASVGVSQDLYAQFQEQKRKVEEELWLMEQRDEQWKQIKADTDYANEKPVPKLNLNQSASEHLQAPVTADQLYDLADDITQEVDLIGDETEIKQFVAVETLLEQGPVRAVAFHPTGECYAVGSNTKILRVCQYPDMSKVTTSYHMATRKPKVLAKKVKHHAGSIYCVAWNTLGTVIASGSNDHSVKCIQWLGDQSVFGSEKSISVHDGTVRDVSFLSTDQLLSAGAGDCTVCLTDIASGSVVRRYKGHTGHVLSLFPHRESQKFVSGGQDKRALMWDSRMSVPVQTYQSTGSLADSAFASVCLDPTPRVLASGHDNSYCSLYDLRQGRMLQAWKAHTDEVRSARFNSDASYFLSGSYDTTVKLMDMQGDITQPLRTVQVAEHMDKVIQCRWHPLLPSFVTSSADKTVTCWAIQIDN